MLGSIRAEGGSVNFEIVALSINNSLTKTLQGGFSLMWMHTV